MGLKILIVGVNGEDGRLLVKRIKKSNRLSIIFGVGTTKEVHNDIKGLVNHYLNVDFTDKIQAQNCLDSVKPNVIVNFAALHGNSIKMKILESNSSELMYRVNFGIGENILNWQLKNTYSKSIMALSSQMYGDMNRIEKIDINSPIAPINLYGHIKSHLWSYQKELIQSGNIFTSGLVLFTHTSIYSSDEFLIPRLGRIIANSIINKKPAELYVNPQQLVDISSAIDVINGIATIIEQDKFENHYIFSSGKLQSIAEIIEIAQIYFGVPFEIISNSSEKHASIYGDIRLTERTLGWQQKSNSSIELVKWIEKNLT